MGRRSLRQAALALVLDRHRPLGAPVAAWSAGVLAGPRSVATAAHGRHETAHGSAGAAQAGEDAGAPWGDAPCGRPRSRSSWSATVRMERRRPRRPRSVATAANGRHETAHGSAGAAQAGEDAGAPWGDAPCGTPHKRSSCSATVRMERRRRHGAPASSPAHGTSLPRHADGTRLPTGAQAQRRPARTPALHGATLPAAGRAGPALPGRRRTGAARGQGWGLAGAPGKIRNPIPPPRRRARQWRGRRWRPERGR